MNSGCSTCHEVTIAQPFAVGTYEVTRGQFSAFVEETAHVTGDRCETFEVSDGKYTREERLDRDWRNPGISKTDDHPVVCLTWDDTVAFTAWLLRAREELVATVLVSQGIGIKKL